MPSIERHSNSSGRARLHSLRLRDANLARPARTGEPPSIHLLESESDGLILVAADGLVLSSNHAAELMSGFDATEMLGKPIGDVWPSDRRHEITWLLERAREGGSVSDFRTTRVRRGGEPVPVAVWVWPQYEPTGWLSAIAILVRDLTVDLAPQHHAMHLHSYLGAMLEQIDCAVLLCDPAGKIAYLNEAMLEWSGLDRSETLRMGRAAFLGACASRFTRSRDFLHRIRREGPAAEEFELALRGDTRRVMRWRGTPVALPDGTGRLDLLRDVTAEVTQREGLAHSALTDVLTGLLNRRGAEMAIPREIKRARRSGTSLGVALLDIDHFKRVNDRDGHAAGDAALRAVVDAVSTQLRGADLLARWGGDEILAVFPDTDLAGTRRLSERVRNAVALGVRAGRRPLTVSVGIGELRDGEDDLGPAIERADEALYLAKERGRDRVEPGSKA
jgi:diguanylate cyclase (GGDEF)-like protein/PAS domain S-box-containing protein